MAEQKVVQLPWSEDDHDTAVSALAYLEEGFDAVDITSDGVPMLRFTVLDRFPDGRPSRVTSEVIR